MFASMPLSSPSHLAGARSADKAVETLSAFDAFLAVAIVVVVAAALAPSIIIPAVIVVAIAWAVVRGLRGLGEALEPLADGRVQAVSGAALINLNYTR
jgi:hypothetical protein